MKNIEIEFESYTFQVKFDEIVNLSRQHDAWAKLYVETEESKNVYLCFLYSRYIRDRKPLERIGVFRLVTSLIHEKPVFVADWYEYADFIERFEVDEAKIKKIKIYVKKQAEMEMEQKRKEIKL